MRTASNLPRGDGQMGMASTDRTAVQKVAEILRTSGLSEIPLSVLERAGILVALERFGGNRSHAAASLGIAVRTLQRKLNAWSLAEQAPPSAEMQAAALLATAVHKHPTNGHGRGVERADARQRDARDRLSPAGDEA
jgi:hypothetical protein